MDCVEELKTKFENIKNALKNEDQFEAFLAVEKNLKDAIRIHNDSATYDFEKIRYTEPRENLKPCETTDEIRNSFFRGYYGEWQKFCDKALELLDGKEDMLQVSILLESINDEKEFLRARWNSALHDITEEQLNNQRKRCLENLSRHYYKENGKDVIREAEPK